MFKCLFGHKMRTTHQLRQKIYSSEDIYLGIDLFYVQKCQNCGKEKAFKIDHYWLEERKLHPEYVKSLFDYCKKD